MKCRLVKSNGYSGLMKGESEGDELAFLRYLECLPPLDEADEAVGCACRPWATAGFLKREHDVGEERIDGDYAAAGEWTGVSAFHNIVSTVQADLACTALRPFMMKRHWNSHRFYANS